MLASTGAVVFVLLRNVAWTFVFGLAAAVCLVLAVRASRILTHASGNIDAARELVRRFIRMLLLARSDARKRVA